MRKVKNTIQSFVPVTTFSDKTTVEFFSYMRSKAGMIQELAVYTEEQGELDPNKPLWRIHFLRYKEILGGIEVSVKSDSPPATLLDAGEVAAGLINDCFVEE